MLTSECPEGINFPPRGKGEKGKKKVFRFLSALQLLSKHRHREAEYNTVCPEMMDER